MKRFLFVFSLLVSVSLCLGSCAELKQNRPILPLRDYEKMIVGRLDADYVGTNNCVSKCHKHDKITEDFKHSVHGEQVKPENGLPLVNCESCHGPGSLAIAEIDENVKLHGEAANKCDTTKFIDLQNLPAIAQSLICLKCHSTASTPNLTLWNSSTHALNEVSCFDCHKLHLGPQQKLTREAMADLCYTCHPDIKMQSSLISHHPLKEKKLVCTDCHDVHGSLQGNLLRGSTPKETCIRCHMDKQGPYVFEHGDVTENCANCHAPHGSAFPPLLNVTMPFLCLQCHAGHLVDTSSGQGVKQLFMNRCTDCHSQIHGTDSPAAQKNRSLPSGTLRQ